MSEATQSVAPRGALFLWLGIAGAILALFFVVEGLIQIGSGRVLAGVGSLIFGAFDSWATFRVLKLARETGARTKLPAALQ